jgi:Putative quorum-sensing-regulated virulence factor
MTIRDKALLHRRWNPSPDLCGRYIDTAALRARFGRYDGAELQDIPERYLLWCLSELRLTTQERRAIELRLYQTPSKSIFLALDPMAQKWREGSLMV